MLCEAVQVLVELLHPLLVRLRGLLEDPFLLLQTKGTTMKIDFQRNQLSQLTVFSCCFLKATSALVSVRTGADVPCIAWPSVRPPSWPPFSFRIACSALACKLIREWEKAQDFKSSPYPYLQFLLVPLLLLALFLRLWTPVALQLQLATSHTAVLVAHLEKSEESDSSIALSGNATQANKQNLRTIQIWRFSRHSLLASTFRSSLLCSLSPISQWYTPPSKPQTGGSYSTFLGAPTCSVCFAETRLQIAKIDLASV